jgi:hypothetical protein
VHETIAAALEDGELGKEPVGGPAVLSFNGTPKFVLQQA